MVAIIMSGLTSVLYLSLFTSKELRRFMSSSIFFASFHDVLVIVTMIVIYAIFGILPCAIAIAIIQVLNVTLAFKIIKGR